MQSPHIEPLVASIGAGGKIGVGGNSRAAIDGGFDLGSGQYSSAPYDCMFYREVESQRCVTLGDRGLLLKGGNLILPVVLMQFQGNQCRHEQKRDHPDIENDMPGR
jgi:hypothetical protein